MRKAVLFYNKHKSESLGWARRVRSILGKEGLRVLGDGQDYSQAAFGIAIGGDGTMLRAARALAPYGIPVAGINTGGLGFLSGTETEEAEGDIVKIAEGRFPVEDRMMLVVEVHRGKRRAAGPALALNDCVVRSSEQARAFYLRAELGGRLLTHYFGDGLIVSTPTGSTAYALAAQGPIVEPSLSVLTLTPICPHALTQRPLVLPFDKPLTLELAAPRNVELVPALLSLDGQVNRRLVPGDMVVVSRYEKPFKMISNPRRGYFDILRAKLQWGAETRGKRK